MILRKVFNYIKNMVVNLSYEQVMQIISFVMESGWNPEVAGIVICVLYAFAYRNYISAIFKILKRINRR